jgi:ribose/xylose/arabinose/galactoside ABC-type transport system permease subunit
MKFLAAMFSEAGGAPSSTRALAAMVTVCVVGTWAAVSLRKNELQPMSAELVMLVGVALCAKVWQRGKEGNGHTEFLTKEPK